MHDESTKALRETRPDAAEDIEAYAVLRDRIVAADCPPDPAIAARRPGLSMARRWGIAGTVAAMGAVAVLATVLSVTAPTPGSNTAVPNAYAAVRKAVVRTAQKSDSGEMSTRLTVTWNDHKDPIVVGTGLKWHGDDVSLALRTQQPGAESTMSPVALFVGGQYYEHDSEDKNAKWIHHDGADAASTLGVGAWAKAARKDISGERISHVINALIDLTQETTADGSTVYVGHSTAGEIDSAYHDEAGLPWMSRPFPKLGDASTDVNVKIVVGSDGVIRSWTCAYRWDNADWLYTCEYSGLGTSPAIEAPKASDTKESDGTWG